MWTVVILSLWSLSQIHWVPLIKDCQSYFWFCVTTIDYLLNFSLKIVSSLNSCHLPVTLIFPMWYLAFRVLCWPYFQLSGCIAAKLLWAVIMKQIFFACFILLKFLSKHVYTHVYCSKTFMVFKGLNIHNFLFFVISIPKQYVRE